MDSSTQHLLEDSYMETVEEALSAGHPEDTAHSEGITAAAMMLASMEGIEDAVARATVDGLSFHPQMLDDS